MKYQAQTTSGAWVRSEELLNGSSAKIVSETQPQPSSFTNKDGSPKTQDVCKVKFESADESVNVSLNRATISGLVDAFGEESGDWQGKLLKVETEKMRVAGKAVTALYLIPSGYERVDNEDGYATIVKIGNETEIPTVESDDVNADLQNETNEE